MRAPTPPKPPSRPGRWRAIALATIAVLYLTAIAAATGICVAMSWKAGLP